MKIKLTGRKPRLLFYILLAIAFSIFLAVHTSQKAVAQGPTPTDDEVNRIAHQLYCPVCENTPLDVCPTEACRQWRDLIRQQLSQGWTEQQIKQYFSEQYGARVLAEPPRTGFNWLAYVLPPAVILAAAFLLLRAMRAWTKPAGTAAASKPGNEPPHDDYVARLEEELKRENSPFRENVLTETDNMPLRRGVPLWAQLIIWGVLVALLVLVAVTLNRSQRGTVQPGDKIGEFTLPLFSGYEYGARNELQLSDLRGKVVLINFWASWCKPCEQEAAALEGAWQYYRDGGQVIFVGADYVDTEPEARAFLKKFGATFPAGPDVGTRLSQLFRIKGVPETYFIDRNGVLQYVQVGPFTSVEEIRAIIDPMLR